MTCPGVVGGTALCSLDDGLSVCILEALPCILGIGFNRLVGVFGLSSSLV